MKLRSKYILSMQASLIPLVLLGLIMIRNHQALAQSQSQMEQFTQEMEAVNHLQLRVAQLPVAPNDYLSTGDKAERERFAQSVAEVESAFAELAVPQELTDAEQTLTEDARQQVEGLIESSEAILALSDPVSNPTGIALMRQIDATANQVVAGPLSQIHASTLVEMADARSLFQLNLSIATRWQVFGLPLTLVISILVGTVLAGSIIAPVRELHQGANKMAAGQFDHRLAVRTNDEIGLLARAFNQMAEQLTGFYAELERQVAERTAALAYSEARFRGLAETAVDAIITIDSDKQIRFFNAAAEQIFGYSTYEAVGQDVDIIIPPKYADAHKTGFQRYFETGKPHIIGQTVELEGLRNGGEIFPLEMSISEVRTNEGVSFTSIIRDISKRKQAEAQIRKLSRAIEHSLNATIIYDQNGNIEYVNGSFSQMSGYEPDEVVGRHVKILGDTITTPKTFKKMWETLSRGNNWQGEFYNQHKNGEQYWVSASTVPIKNEAGVITHFVETHENITDRKIAELELHQRNRDLMLLNHIISASQKELEPRIILELVCRELTLAFDLTHAAAALLNADASSLQIVAEYRANNHPTQLGVVMPVAEHPFVERLVQKRETLVMSDAARFLETAGETGVWPRETAALLVTPLTTHDEVLGTLALVDHQPREFSAQEISLAEHAAQAMAQVLVNVRLFTEINNALNRERQLAEITRTINSALEQTVVLETVVRQAVELVGGDAGSLALIDPDGTTISYPYIFNLPASLSLQPARSGHGVAWRVVETGDSVLVADYSTQPDALPQWIAAGIQAILAVPIIVGENRIGALGLFGLTSERQFSQHDLLLAETVGRQAGIAIQNARLFEAEQAYAAELETRVSVRTAELSAVNASLARAIRAKDEFLANMSHELRTPLSAILLRSELVRRQVYGKLSEKQTDSLKIIEEAGYHLLSLINDILDVAKIGAGKLKLDIKTVSVKSVCQASLQLVREMARKKGIDLIYEVEPPAVSLQADNRRLKQILVNLLSNAVKFTPEGGRVGLEVSDDAEQEIIQFTVWDTGIGMSAEDLKRLFQPFEQLDSGLSRQFEGTGLGLVLVRRLVELHLGSVSVNSKVGVGSKFMVMLPWKPNLSPEIGLQGVDTIKELPVDSIAPPDIGQEKTILLADDNEELLIGMADVLTQLGYRVLVVRNGAEAVARAGETLPDLILMDSHMPEIDGLEAIRRIRKMERLAEVPIISLTALAMPGDRERCLEAGASDYLSKPVTLDNLLTMIRKFLGKVS